LKGDTLIRMVPQKDGKANHGHSCVKGRFAFGYATHQDRITEPMIRENITDPWRVVSWEEAYSYAAKKLKKAQADYGVKAIGGITSSRCTNEEVWLVQRLIRQGFGNNNVDTCARVCHSPTGDGLKQTFGESAGTQNFDSVMDADCIIVIGSNPTDAHPVFGSQMKRRLRGLDGKGKSMPSAALTACARSWKAQIADPANSPERVSDITGVPKDDLIAAARLYATSPNSAIYYGLGVTEHSQGSMMVMGMANLAMATGNIGRPGVGVNPMRGQNNVQGSCDMGSFPHELSGYRPVGDDAARGLFETKWGTQLDSKPGYRIPNMFDEACAGNYKGMYIQGEDVAQFNAERRINRVRPVMESATGKQEWEVTQDLGRALGIDMGFTSSSQIMDEIADLTPSFANVSFDVLDAAGSLQWPVNDDNPDGAEIMHVGEFVRGKGKFVPTEYIPTPEKTNRRFPLILTTGRILSQYNVGAQTRRTENNLWWEEDVLEIHPSDAQAQGVADGQWVSLKSRKGEITLRAVHSSRMAPGVVYTTFHHPDTGANVITTENTDPQTSCPEYKVTAVSVSPANHKSDWQMDYERELDAYRQIEPAE